MTSRRNEQLMANRAELKRRQEREREYLRQRQAKQTAALSTVDKVKERLERVKGELAKALEEALPHFDEDVAELADLSGIPKSEVQAMLKQRKEIAAETSKVKLPS